MPTLEEILALASRLAPEAQRRLVAALSAQLAQTETALEASRIGERSASDEPRLTQALAGLPIYPNGLDPNSGRPLLTLDPAAVLAAARSPERAQLAQLHAQRVTDDSAALGLVYGISYDELAEAGWALVVNSADDSALIKALSPLLVHRARAQGLRLPPLDFRAGERCGHWLARHVADFNRPLAADAAHQVPVLLYRPGEPTAAWLERHGVAARAVDPALGVPFYLCLAGRPGPLAPGDTAFIPFEFQYQLDMFWGVGRLCFNDLGGAHRYQDYATYAERLVAFETQAAGKPARHIVYFGTEHPDDPATRTSASELLRPLHDGRPAALSAADRYGFTQALYLAEQARKSQLTTMLRGDAPEGRPALLFTATHGLGFGLDDPRLPAHQGALVCQDWSGDGSVRREDWFCAEDLEAGWSIDGLIVLSMACYSLGCPAEDQFMWPGSGEPRQIAPHALVTQLPQALLLRGALAVFGHVDRAWTSSFRSRLERSAPATARMASAQVQAFDDLLRRLMDGKRVGFATDQFNAQQGAVAVELSDLLARASRSSDAFALAFEIGQAWAVRNDLRNYAVLGDPAVRLAV